MTKSGWDARLILRGTRLVEAQADPGQSVWRVIRGEFWDGNKAPGKHHVYVDTINERGQRLPGVWLLVRWSTGSHRIMSELKAGEPAAANFPMTPGRNAFSIRVDDGVLSDEVTGIGMGDDTPGGFNAGEHTSTFLIFQRTRAGETAPPPLPPAPQPPTAGDVYTRLMQVQARIEEGQAALSIAQANFGAAQAMLQQVIDGMPRG